jgi:hypothetical protein
MHTLPDQPCPTLSSKRQQRLALPPLLRSSQPSHTSLSPQTPYLTPREDHEQLNLPLVDKYSPEAVSQGTREYERNDVVMLERSPCGLDF